MSRQPLAEKPASDANSQPGNQVSLKDYRILKRTVVRQGRQLAQARQALEQRAEQLRAAGLQLAEAEQQERRRLAHLLHDHIQQLLVAARMQSDMLLEDQSPGRSRRSVQMIHDLLGEAVEASRSLTSELSPPILRQQGLSAALNWLGGEFRRKHNLLVTAQLDPQAEPAGEARQEFLYAAVRELLFNVVKHSRSNQAEIRMSSSGPDTTISVCDSGRGFDARSATDLADNSFGLHSIRDRIALLGGSMEISSAPGQGSVFTLTLPRVPAAERLGPE